MSLWRRLFRREPPPDVEPAAESSPADDQLIALPNEPFVFECRDCGKVFEARRKKPLCPECDGRNVELLSG